MASTLKKKLHLWILERLGVLDLQAKEEALRVKVYQLLDRSAKQEGALKLLRDELMRCRHIDLVESPEIRSGLGRVKLFLYTEDLNYTQRKEATKHRPACGEFFRPVPLPTWTPREVYDAPDSQPMDIVMAHYWLHDLLFTHLDVGAQYGETSILAARLIAACGQDNRVIAFEPGMAGALLEANLQINHMNHRVAAERIAVGGGTFPVLLFGELGHSENNRIVNRDPASEVISTLVQCTSIDEYVQRQGIDGHLTMKIDTQGAEFEVLQGMQRVMQERMTAFVTEFTPHALMTRVDPLEWVQGLMREHHVMDIPEFANGTARGLTRLSGNLQPFLEAVNQRPYQYTDLMVIPKRLPDAEQLVARLARRG